MSQEDEPDEPDPDDRDRVLRVVPVPEREEVERDRVVVVLGFAAVERDFAAVERGFDAVDFAAVDLAAVDRVPVEREREAAGLRAAGFAAAGFAAAADDDELAARRLVSSAVTRRARFSISPRRPRRSSSTFPSSSDSRTRETALATSSTISRPRAFEPSGSARSTALRICSTVSGAPEPFLSFFFLSFFAMARV
jgi:hypothetical protein